MFALLRAEAEQAGRYQSLAHFYSREEVKFCDMKCQNFVRLWEADNHIYEDPFIYENLNPNPNAFYENPQP